MGCRWKRKTVVLRIEMMSKIVAISVSRCWANPTYARASLPSQQPVAVMCRIRPFHVVQPTELISYHKRSQSVRVGKLEIGLSRGKKRLGMIFVTNFLSTSLSACSSSKKQVCINIRPFKSASWSLYWLLYSASNLGTRK